MCGSIKNLFKLKGEGLDGQSDGEGQGDEDGAAASDQAQAAPKAVASVSVTNSPELSYLICCIKQADQFLVNFASRNLLPGDQFANGWCERCSQRNKHATDVAEQRFG